MTTRMMIVPLAAWFLVLQLAVGAPMPEKYKPMMDSCVGKAEQTACSTSMPGVCQSDPESGRRFCAEPKKHRFVAAGGGRYYGDYEGAKSHMMQYVHSRESGPYSGHGSPHPFEHRYHGDKMGGHGHPHPDYVAGRMPYQRFGVSKNPGAAGDCAKKRDGEACSVARHGQCVASGRCPIFHGQVICKPADVHPPVFVTVPCEDKEEDMDCRLPTGPGRCAKAAFENLLVCRAISKADVSIKVKGLHKFQASAEANATATFYP